MPQRRGMTFVEGSALATLFAFSGTYGCGQPQRHATPAAISIADVTSNTSTALPNASVLGFETTAGWSVTNGTAVLSSETNHDQGQFSLGVTGQNYIALTSAPLLSLGSPLSTATIDILLPTAQPDPSYFGAVQMYVNLPSEGVNEDETARMGIYCRFSSVIGGGALGGLIQTAVG